MSTYWKATMVPVVLCATMAFASRARAQASAVDMAASSCAVDENTPRSVQEAAVMIVEALNAKTDAAKRIPLLSAAKILSVPSAAGAPNPGGRAYELGRVLVLWLDLENQPVITSKGSIGLTGAPGDTAQRIDLSVWIDSTFSIVEKAIPSCAQSIDGAWRQHPGWFRLVQRAVQQANAGKFDSASVTVTQASRIYAGYPYTSFVMAQIAAARGDHATAVAKYNETIELSKQDSGFAKVQHAAEAAMGNAPAVPATSYKTVMSDPNAPYADVVAAGLAANAARQMGDAIRLFRRAVEMNPYQRDALSDLVTLLAETDSASTARPFVDRLLKVDPSNPNNYLLAQQVYASLQVSAQKTAKRYADQGQTQPAAAWTDSATAFGKTSLSLLDKKDAMVVGVQFGQWIPRDGGVTIAGVLTNTAAAAKTVVVHVEFLDKGGNTVSTGEITVTVDPKGSKQFSLSGNGAGIAAFKYTPLS